MTRASIVQWLAQPARRVYVAVLFLLLCVVLTLLIALVVRVFNDEHNGCVIQARGLPAGHQLAAAMADIHTLLTLKPTTRAQRLAKSDESPQQKRTTLSLAGHLALYQAEEAAQPQHRSC